MLNKLQAPERVILVSGNDEYLSSPLISGNVAAHVQTNTVTGWTVAETAPARPEVFDYACLVLLLLTAVCFGGFIGFVCGKKHRAQN
jgi:hypothetical protein